MFNLFDIAVQSRKWVAAAGIALMLGVGTMAPAEAQASTATTSFSVSATVLSSCAVSASLLAFGSYNPIASTATTGNTTLLVTCTSGTPYNIGLNPGTGTGATVASRKMTSGSNLLSYSLYQNASLATVWGQTIGTDTVTGTGTGLPVSVTVYGSVPSLQTVPSGAYTDTISVTVTY
jgi:spore coat protein U-like protein